jgi:hypothetical protein
VQKIIMVLGTVSLSLAAGAQAQSLGKILDKLANTAQGDAVTPSAAQTSAIAAALNARQGNPRIASDVAEARPLLERTLRTLSCATAAPALNSLNRARLEPQTYQAYHTYYYVPTGRTKFHDKRRCMDVVRLGEWKKPAANILSVRAYFVSPSSEEAVSQEVVYQREEGGAWLIRSIEIVR